MAVQLSFDALKIQLPSDTTIKQKMFNGIENVEASCKSVVGFL